MGIEMAALAVSFLTALAFGTCLWFSLACLRFLIKLLISKKAYAKRGWGREVWHCCCTLFVTVAIILFLYSTNRGILRWFLVGGVAGTFLLWEKWIGAKLYQWSDRWIQTVHRFLLRTFLILTVPLRWLACRVYRMIRNLCMRIYLKYRRECAKLIMNRYDKKERQEVGRRVRDTLTELLDQPDAKIERS